MFKSKLGDRTNGDRKKNVSAAGWEGPWRMGEALQGGRNNGGWEGRCRVEGHCEMLSEVHKQIRYSVSVELKTPKCFCLLLSAYCFLFLYMDHGEGYCSAF